MNVLIEIGVNLVVAFISFGLGWAWKRMREEMKLRGARRFWKPFVREQTQIVLPRFFRDKFEQVGRIGAGTANGLIELSSYFRLLGVDNLNILYADLLQGDTLKSNLILIGGPPSHALTEEVLARVKSTFQFRDFSSDYNLIYDAVAEKFCETRFREHVGHPDAKEVSVDYGMILKAVNPFDDRKLLLIIAGNFDYGTWAGIRFVMSEEFIGNRLVVRGKPVEALIEVDVLRGSPQRIKLVDLRELQQ